MDKIWLGFFDTDAYTDTIAFKTKELANEWFDRVTKNQIEDFDEKIENYIYRDESEDHDFREFLMGDNPYCRGVRICIVKPDVRDNLEGLFE